MEEQQHIEEIDLQKYWLVLRRRWLPASLVFVTTLSLATAYALTRNPVYEASGQLLFQIDSKTSLTGFGTVLAEQESFSLQNNPLDTQAVIIESNSVVRDTIEELNLRNETGDFVPPTAIKGGLNVTVVPGTDVLRVSFTGPDPERAAAIVDQIMESYIDQDVLNNRTQAAAAREFVDQELPQALEAVDEAAEELRRFKDNNGIIALEQEASVAVDIVANLDDRINQANAELVSILTRSGELEQQLGMSSEQAVDLNALSQAPGVQQALTELQDTQTQLATAQSRYTSNHPTVENLQRQETSAYVLLQERVAQVLGQNVEIAPGLLQSDTLQQQLTAELVQSEIDQLALASSIESLITARDTYLDWSSAFPALEKQQRLLENQLAAAQVSYDSLLARKQEIQLAENQSVGNASIIQRAKIPEFSIGRSKKLYVAAGGVVGIFLGIAAAFLLDLIDRSLKTVKEAETLFGYPVLGVIPKYGLPAEPSLEEPLPATTPMMIASLNPVVADAYQMLQANLKFMSTDRKLKTLVVSSSVLGEGKSSVAALLALSISQSGRRVLLIDADLRSPDQHHVWNVVNGIGLSHVLVGEGSLKKALQPVTENLTLMTAGVTPPNALALLDSAQMARLLDTLSQPYDTVIIDTPPLAGAADAAILGKIADGFVLVIRSRLADSAKATAAKSLLQRSGTRVLGLVANAIETGAEHEDYLPYAATRTEKEMKQKAVAVRSSPRTETFNGLEK
ncbi:MAG: polysaccharide biosynthesis tyrosine autokinase [Cyanobacteria bacterium P01_A01_bin.123]